jgi:hypothetical protein
MKIKSWRVPDVPDFEIFGGSVVSWFMKLGCTGNGFWEVQKGPYHHLE